MRRVLAVLSLVLLASAPSYAQFTTAQMQVLSNLFSGSMTNIYSMQGSKTKSLTDAGAAVAFVNVAIPASGYAGGEVTWSVTSTDSTDYRVTQGIVRFAGVNKAGTMTCTGNVVGTDLTASSNANTLVCTWTFTTGTASCDVKVTCTDNTAGTQPMTLYGQVNQPILNTLTFP
jgi:hypothetical protein